VEGLLLLDKPTGPTSHDMVAAVREMCGGAKTGHAGTLDPLASGLLVILIGRATKLAPYIPGDPKVYDGTILLGLSTDSMDLEGDVTSRGVFTGDTADVKAAMDSLVGELEQEPPMYSAAKYRGSPLYRYARKGEVVPRKARKVRILRSEMTAFRSRGERAEVDFHIECSPGTYVRELAARVGDMLGCGGTLSKLRRTASGPFRVENALTLEVASTCFSEGTLNLLPLQEAVAGYKRMVISPEFVKAARNGVTIEEDMIGSAGAVAAVAEIVAVFAEGEIVGMHSVVSKSPLTLKPLRIL
jgi:tRNA pseudouridine55 synthase